jgi:hypothetical protein
MSLVSQSRRSAGEQLAPRQAADHVAQFVGRAQAAWSPLTIWIIFPFIADLHFLLYLVTAYNPLWCSRVTTVHQPFEPKQ